MAAWLTTTGISVGVSLVTFLGAGGLVHWWFYVRRRGEAARWKLQPKRWLSDRLTRQAIGLGTLNIAIGGLCGGTFAWYVQQGGWSALHTELPLQGWLLMPLSALAIYFLIDAGLYYSHRLLHRRRLFRRIHFIHHRYTTPIIFTTTAVHPLEFLLFQTCVLLPAFVVPAHWTVYVGVVAYTYLIGMIDHCGVRVRWPLPLHAGNRFHDDHHVYFHCNYGHHTQLWDRLHATVRIPEVEYDAETFEDMQPGRRRRRRPARSAKAEAAR